MHSGVSGVRNGDTLFFMLGWDRYGFDKKTCWVTLLRLVFLHPVGTAGCVVHSGASGVRNGDAIFFMLRRNRYGFNRKTLWVKLRRIGLRIWSDL
jgi:hypothetical protein